MNKIFIKILVSLFLVCGCVFPNNPGWVYAQAGSMDTGAPPDDMQDMPMSDDGAMGAPGAALPGQTGQAVLTGPILDIKEREPAAEGESSRYRIELRDVELRDFFRVVAYQYDLNLFIDNAIQGTITASFSDVTLDEALNAILESNNLIMQNKGGIYRVTRNLQSRVFVLKHLDANTLLASTDSEGTDTSLDTSDTGGSSQFSDIFSLLSSAGSILQGQQPNSIMVIDYPPNVERINEFLNMADQRMVSKVFRLNFLNAAEVVGRAASSTISGGSSDTSDTEDTEDAGDDTTDTTDTSDTESDTTSSSATHSTITELLSSAGRVLYGEQPNSILVIDYQDNIDRIEEYLSIADVAAQEVLIEARVVEVSLEGQHALGINWDLLTRKQDEIKIGQFKVQTPLTQNIDYKSTTEPGGTADETAFSFEIWNKNLHTIISLLANSLDTNLLSAPSIATLNNHAAKIEVVKRLPWAEPDVNTVEIGDDTYYSITWEINFENEGITLEVLPTIAPDGRIIMSVIPEVSQHVDDYPLEVTYGTQTVDYTVPIIDTRRAETKVIVENGQTLIIGGLIKSEVVKAVTKLPIVGDLPIIGSYFSSQKTSEEKIELLILLSPTIIDRSEYARAAREEKYGLGKWYTKERRRHDRTVTARDVLDNKRKRRREMKYEEKNVDNAVTDAMEEARGKISAKMEIETLKDKYKELEKKRKEFEKQVKAQQRGINSLNREYGKLAEKRMRLQQEILNLQGVIKPAPSQ